MKKISLLIIALMLAPGVLSAHSSHSDTITLPITQDLSQYDDCASFEECPGFRNALIEVLQELLRQLLEAKLLEAGGEIEQVDYSDFEDATYQVLSTGKLSGQSAGLVPDISIEIWDEFTKVAPQEYIKDYVSYLRVYYDDDDFSAAYVETDQNDYDKWGLGVNLSDLDTSSVSQKKNLVETLVHEFAHILTLNNDQVDSSVTERRCGTYYLSEGCTFKNSYINEFVQEFWDEDDFDHAEAIEDEDDSDERDDLADEYFEDNAGDYVTPYASWHPAEDIAESFAYFVLQDKPTGNTEADQKMLFFYEFSELTDMRSDIRVNQKALFNF